MRKRMQNGREKFRMISKRLAWPGFIQNKIAVSQTTEQASLRQQAPALRHKMPQASGSTKYTQHGSLGIFGLL